MKPTSIVFLIVTHLCVLLFGLWVNSLVLIWFLAPMAAIPEFTVHDHMQALDNRISKLENAKRVDKK